jgi:formylglycine-generating enzyme required for sulfatase activity
VTNEHYARPDLSLNQANFHGPYPYPPSNADKTPHLRRPTKVGSYPPNKLGLYDMHGNISQWCADRYKTADPEAPDNRMVRGGSWQDDRPNRAARSGVVGATERRGTLGFRLVRVPSGGN